MRKSCILNPLLQDGLGDAGNVFMRVTCKECGYKGRISHSVPLTDDNGATMKDLYCQCLNVECGHTWVMTLAFKHTLNPPVNSDSRALFEQIQRLSPTEQQDLLRALS